ncbi:MAG TPA: cytochrome P450 [Acidimicrobiales bacterium]|jgi:cytochrome P450|nr:cytochrome P450 [Acidimicrobiales bacterium]
MADAVLDPRPTGEMFDPTDAAYRRDPYPTYQRLLDAGRVHQSLFGGPVLVRHADCLAVLHHPQASSDETNSTMYRQGVESGLISPDEEMLERRPFLFRDPPDHTRLRRLVSKAFTPRRIEALRPRLIEIVDELLAPIEPGATIDVIEDLAYPLPVQVICELLGVPASDHPVFAEWSRYLARSLDPDFLLSPDQVDAQRAAIDNFHQYFIDLIAVRRNDLGDDLLSALIAAEEDGDRLNETELHSTLVLLLVAGHETTVNLITNGVHALLRNPDQRALVAADDSLVPSLVEEVLRWDPPVQIDGRTMMADVDIDGLPLAAGETVLMLLAAANRDPEVFDDPSRFDVTRTDNPHVSFGHGIHHCLGAALARAEGQVALGALIRRFPEWELATDEVEYKENLVLRGLAALPVRFS